MSGPIRAIRSEADYKAALARIDELMDAEPDTLEGDELDVLADLVELYEHKHIPMVYGLLPFKGKPKSLEEMDAAVLAEAARRHHDDRN